MAVAQPVDITVNPNNTAQRYILWGNGRVDPVGGAVPVVDQATWYDRIDQPVVVALHISNWATGAGYMLSANGSIHEFNGAPDIGDGILEGVPYTPSQKTYIDWSWNTAGNGQGYILDVYGKLWPFGGATAYTAPQMWGSPLAKKLIMQWSPTKYGIVLDERGGLHDVFTAQTFTGGASWSSDVARDLVITTWSANPAGYLLDSNGGVHEVGSAPATFGYPYRAGADVARLLYVVSTIDPIQLGEIWSGGQTYQWTSSTPPTAVAGAGQSEIQRVAITGTPTGGTFTLTYSGQTTAAIAYNATAATVQTALRALSNIGSTGVTVTGGPGPGTAWTVAFAGTLAVTDVPQMTATSSLTGGTSPTVAVTTTTPGITASPPLTVTNTTRPMLSWTYSDPQRDSQAAWQVLVYTQAWVNGHSMTDPWAWYKSAPAPVVQTGINPTTRGITCPVDLSNGAYRMYVRVKDSAGQWSAWSNHGWTQNVPVPATPTGLTATANQTTFQVALSVTATTGGSANLIRFESSDDGGATWTPVPGADAVALATTTTATDPAAPLGVTRSYRAIAYAIDPRVASVPSATASATLTTLGYVVTAVDDSTLGGRLRVQDPVEWTRNVKAGVFEGIDADYPTVVKDGGKPRARRSTMHVYTDTAAEWAVLEALVMSRSTLIYRDPQGTVRYCEVVGDWGRQLIRGAVSRSMHTTDVPLVEVQPPQVS